MGVACNLFILLGNTLNGIEDHEDNIGTVHCTQGPDDAVFFNRFVDFPFAAHSCCIYEEISLPILHDRNVNGITGCPCYITDDGAGLAYNVIENGGFAHVRSANDSDLDNVIMFVIIRFILIREMGYNGIKQGSEVESV